LTYRNTQGNGAGNDRNPAHGQATPTQQTKLGTGGRELEVGGQQNKSPEGRITAGGPIPQHRDTTITTLHAVDQVDSEPLSRRTARRTAFYATLARIVYIYIYLHIYINVYTIYTYIFCM